MVATNVKKETVDGLFYCEFAGLSTDNKPTGAEIATGSLYFAVNNGKKYAYDGENAEWDELS